MSKSQAFTAFKLIMRMLIIISYGVGQHGFDKCDEQELSETKREYVEFLHENGE